MIRRSLLAALAGILTISAPALVRAQDTTAPAPAPQVATPDGAPIIAAAASLRAALDEVATAFKAASGKDVRIVYGATGNLVQQIENGAPFQLLLAADQKSVAKLADGGRTEGKGVTFATGQISLVAPKGSAVVVAEGLDGLKKALAEGKVRKFAIANPELAPYGRAAEEALAKAGLMDDIKPKLVLGNNVGEAAQFVASGAADAGIIAYSLAVAPDLAPKLDGAILPAATHAPIRHDLAVIKGAGGVAKDFAKFVAGPEARVIVFRGGFGAP